MSARRSQIKQWLKNVLEDNLQGINYRAFIFGSQANLPHLRRSDIDVGILATQDIPVKYFARINDMLEELPMLYKIDLVDFNEVDEKFKDIAMQNIEWL